MKLDCPTRPRLSSTLRPRLDDVLPVTVSALGVSLFIDRDGEDYYIEAAEVYDTFALVALREFALGVGLEMMSEEECPAQRLDDGSTRIYLAEVIA